MRANIRRNLLVVAVIGGMGGMLAYAFRDQPVAVDLAEVVTAPMMVTVDEEAWTRVKELYAVSAPVAGRLLRVSVKAGDPIRAGETVVAVLQPTDPDFLDPRAKAKAEAELRAAEADLGLAEAGVARAQAELGFLRAELDRAKNLSREGNIARRMLEKADTDVKLQEAMLASAQADREARRFRLQNARAALITPLTQEAGGGERCCLDVTGPVDGRVLRVLRESEGVVAAGTPLVEVGDVADIEVVVELLSNDAVRVREGFKVLLEDWGGPPVLGRVRLVEPFGYKKISALGIEEQRVGVVIDFVGHPPPQLGHGYRVTSRIVLWETEAATRVPIGALFRRGDAWAAFVVEGEVAHERQVRVGWLDGLNAQVLDGLRQGDKVVVHPGAAVEDGVRIEARS